MKVICSKAKTCTKDSMCGAKQPHEDNSCETCPFDTSAKCIEVKPIISQSKDVFCKLFACGRI